MTYFTATRNSPDRGKKCLTAGRGEGEGLTTGCARAGQNKFNFQLLWLNSSDVSALTRRWRNKTAIIFYYSRAAWKRNFDSLFHFLASQWLGKRSAGAANDKALSQIFLGILQSRRQAYTLGHILVED